MADLTWKHVALALIVALAFLGICAAVVLEAAVKGGC